MIKRIRLPLLFLALGAFALSCAPQPAPEETAEVGATAQEETASNPRLVDDERVAEEPTEQVEVPEDAEVIVTFLVGDVVTRENDSFVPVDIGALLGLNDTVQVGADSYAELELGGVATVRVEADSEIVIRELFVGQDETRVRVGLNAGSILSRVERLGTTGAYSVETETTVAGVRGTEFRTAVDSERTATVSVREGEVVVRPRVAAVDEAVPADERQGRRLERVRAELDQIGIQVPANRSVELAEPDARSAAESIGVSEEAVGEALASEDEAGEQRLGAEIRASADAVRAALPQPAATAEEESAALEEIETLHPVTPLRDRGAAAELLSFEVIASPSDAQIFIGGRRAGVGRVAALLRRGDEIELSVERSGFESVSFPVSFTDVRGRLLRVELEEVPETSLRIRTEPVEADIVIDSEIVGTGNVERSFPVGSSFTVTAVHPDFSAEPVSVEVEDDGPQEVVIEMTEREGDEDPEEAATASLRITAEPRNARVSINGEDLGSAPVSRELELGSQVEISVSAEGFEPQTRRVLVQEGGGTQSFALERIVILREISVSASPVEAELSVNGRPVGTGSYTGEHEVGTRLRVGAELEDFFSRSIVVSVTEEGPADFEIVLEPEPVEREVRVEVSPADSLLRVSGFDASAGGGSFTLVEGEEYIVTATRRGYAELKERISIEADGPSSFSFELEPRPLLWRRSASQTPIVRGFAEGPSAVYWASRDGVVGAIDTSGRSLWTTETQNNPNENSLPIYSNDRVYFSGAGELVELDSANGEVLSREPLSGERAHVFGRTVTPTPDGYVFPNNAGLEIGDGEPAEIPGGATMSAAYADGRLFIANNEGVVFVLDAADGEVLAEVETDAVQPVAHAPALWTDTLYFAGRRGVFVAVDIPSATVAWNYDLPGGVFARPLVSEQGVYVFAGGVVTALTHSGEQLFVTPSGVSAAPAVSGGEIAYVTDAPELVVADAESGARIAGYSLPAESATRPVFADGEITVGLSNGEILRLLRESLQ